MSRKTIRVLCYGNQGNLCYRLTLWLRARGIDATLLLQTNFDGERNKPEWEDPTLKDNYPEWIKPFRKHLHNWVIPERKTVRASKDCDVIVTSGSYIVSALALKKPVVFFPVGGDITDIPFDASNLRAELFSYAYRRRINKVQRVVTAQENCIWAASLLKIANKKVVRYPLPVDMDTISRLLNTDLLRELNDRYSTYGLVFFAPTRKNLDPSKADYKGGERVLRAFKRFKESMPSIKTRLVTVMSGNDIAEYRELIKDLGLNDHCDFVKHLTLPELHAYISIKNVVVIDQCRDATNSALGGISRETLTLGSPLIASVDINHPDFITTYGSNCPLIGAFSEDDLLKVMKSLADYPKEKFERLRENSKRWMREHMHWENRIDEFIKILEDVVEKEGST